MQRSFRAGGPLEPRPPGTPGWAGGDMAAPRSSPRAPGAHGVSRRPAAPAAWGAAARPPRRRRWGGAPHGTVAAGPRRVPGRLGSAQPRSGAGGSALLPPEFLPRNFVPGGRRERVPGAGRARPAPAAAAESAGSALGRAGPGSTEDRGGSPDTAMLALCHRCRSPAGPPGSPGTALGCPTARLPQLLPRPTRRAASTRFSTHGAGPHKEGQCQLYPTNPPPFPLQKSPRHSCLAPCSGLLPSVSPEVCSVPSPGLMHRASSC